MVKKAMVLAAGNGTRLHPLTLSNPKPLLMLNNKPIIEYNLDLLKKHGIEEVYINACYLSNKMVEYFKYRPKDELTIHLNVEEKMMGSAGGLKLLEDKLQETFLVVSGDLLTNAPLNHLISSHKEKGALASMGLTKVQDPRQYGIVVVNEEDRIIRFQEKPKTLEEAFSDLINVGIYVFEPTIFSYIPEDTFFDFSKDLFPILLEGKAPLFAFPIHSYWRDLGTIPELEIAENDIKNALFRD